ncbi:MAG: hypothetical protein DDT28_01153 [Dehalococcoidia bacterium]|nr:hypothetical protein [Chloroflexota bacterium]
MHIASETGCETIVQREERIQQVTPGKFLVEGISQQKVIYDLRPQGSGEPTKAS